MSIRSRLVLTYALLLSFAVISLSLAVNFYSGKIFSDFVKANIEMNSRMIVSSLEALYSADKPGFDTAAVERTGMNFVHQGYIVSVYGAGGDILWNARDCDMKRCVDVIRGIEERMKGRHNVYGGFEKKDYPMVSGGKNIGRVVIETYGPVFFSENESRLISLLNRFFAVTGVLFTMLSVVVSTALAYAISKPVLKASDAAKQIAGGNLSVRMAEKSRITELNELSAAINTLASALENGERRQKQLSSDIAHELRTPLTALRGNMEGMLDGLMEPTPERLSGCHEEIMRLASLVDDLNRLSILERDSLVLKRSRFALSGLLSSVAADFSPLAAKKGVALSARCGLNLEITGDYDRLKQVFINLVSNAVNYTDSGSVMIEASEEDGVCRVKITDSGIGIQDKDLSHIFERFYRSDKSRSRSTGGVGIGLTIALAIVKAHGGSIRASSGGAGSVFTVELPLK